MIFDWNISLGNILTVLMGVVSVAVILGRYKEKLMGIESDIKEIKEDLKAASLSVLLNRLATVEKELERARASIHYLANAIHVSVMDTK